MIWPGGTVAIERLAFVPDGLSSPEQPGLPEKGWWWNAAETGRGFFIEWQNGTADMAGFMYDEAGNPVWYLALPQTPDPYAIEGVWRSYAGGQTLTGGYRAPVVSNPNVGIASIRFHSPTTATMTVPGGRQVELTRFRF